MKMNTSKQKVLQAAASLFYQKGFHGASVRDIAEDANVNVSLISYYFKSKQGLLEYAITDYYEMYLIEMETTIKESAGLSPLDQLKKLVHAIIQYKQNYHQLSCFIYRELSLDSIFVREMAVTYLAKENFHIRSALLAIFGGSGKVDLDKEFLLMQLKGMLITPYVLQNEWKAQFIGKSSQQLFVRQYVKTIHQWLEFTVQMSDQPVAFPSSY